MHTVSFSRFGEPAEVLALTQAPLPEPQAGQIRVRMRLSPIHHHDLAIVRGGYGQRPALPAGAGSEALGVVEALGPGVQGLQPGQRVAMAGLSGAWAEAFVGKAASAVALPAAIDDATGCQLLAMPLSALMLLDALALRPGQWLVQNAANGAVGKVLARLAVGRGLRVLGLVRREAGVAELAAHGLADAVCTARPDWRARAQALMGGEPAAAGVDAIGGEATGELLGLLGPGATLLAFGALSGRPMQLDMGALIFRQATVRGFWASAVSAALPAEAKARLVGELLAVAAAGRLLLPVAAVHDLADVAGAVRAVEQPGRAGKVLLRGGAGA